ncbi:type II secretion system secretin GspD [Thiomonas sp. FB-6]|uniref:type II secretion system secretin GspD n=1 Tax=Thiomonas sp. FB-6 TaxID=1158291 RepID=UPI00039FC029|nr:type II secretion system secretin GspD [Thiomonas sp. FB-6]
MSANFIPRMIRPALLRGRDATAWLLCTALGLAPLAPAGAAPRTVERHAQQADARPPMTIDLVNAEISSAVQAVAAATGRNFIVDPRVKGRISLQFKTPVPPQQVYLALLTQLRLAGYAVVEHEGVFKVVPEADARLQTTPVGVGNTSAHIPGRGDQVVTQVFELRNQAASNLLPVLRPLISPNNTINVDPGSNALVITDYADNLRRLARIIAGLDIPTGSEVDVVPLRYAVASELASTLDKLISLQGASDNSRGAAVRAPVQNVGAIASSTGMRAVVLPDTSSNSLIVRASNGVQLMQIEQMIHKLDRPADDDGDDIHVVYLHNASAASLAKVLQGALSNYNADGSTGAGSLQQAANRSLTGAAGGASSGTTSSSYGGSMSGGLGQGSSGGSGSGIGSGNEPQFTPTPDDQTVALPQGGSVYADVSMNALIINAPPPVYRQLKSVIAKLDVARAEVYVQALIVEVSANKLAQLGVQWQSAAGSGSGNNAVFGGTNYSNAANASRSNIIALQTAIASGNGGTALSSGAVAPEQGLNIGILHSIAGITTLGLLANFLQSNVDANILSQPNLMTLDNETARIVVGQNLPFATGSYTSTGNTSAVSNPFTTYSRQDVGLILKIRPQITAGNVLKLDVYTENSTVVAPTAQQAQAGTFITNTRSLQTTVLVNNGQTIVLGGLMQNQVSANDSKVPGLGDIPVLGLLFGGKSHQAVKTDLMVFLRPVIVRKPDQAEGLSRGDYTSMQSVERGAQLPPSFALPLMPGPILPDLGPAQPPAPAPAPAPVPAPAAAPAARP